MIVATHQPNFLPWPGLFVKAMMADCLVLLDDVQFPRGRSWVNRNRLKNEQGELWLTVPVHKKGRDLQRILDVELFKASDWKRKHLRGIRQSYANAPYLDNYLPGLVEIYEKDHRRLISLNLALISYLLKALGLERQVLLQSDLEITGRATDLILNICQELEAENYLTFPISMKHLDTDKLNQGGVEIVARSYCPPVYPQLWGDFLSNLSVLDLVMNCGPVSESLLRESTSG
jgi:hypothetical protein